MVVVGASVAPVKPTGHPHNDQSIHARSSGPRSPSRQPHLVRGEMGLLHFFRVSERDSLRRSRAVQQLLVSDDPTRNPGVRRTDSEQPTRAARLAFDPGMQGQNSRPCASGVSDLPVERVRAAADRGTGSGSWRTPLVGLCNCRECSGSTRDRARALRQRSRRASPATR